MLAWTSDKLGLNYFHLTSNEHILRHLKTEYNVAVELQIPPSSLATTFLAFARKLFLLVFKII